MTGYLLTLSRNIVSQLILYIGALSILGGQAVHLACVPPFKWSRVLAQAQRIGPGSFFISALIAFFIGVIMALQMAYQMTKLSAEIYIPNVIAVSLTRELAPVLTALIVAGRIGAGITAELGSMAVTEQVEALKAFAVNPIKYLVVPRFLGLVLMLPVLTVFADLIGIVGGFVICTTKLFISPALYVTMIADSLEIRDVVTGLLKTIFFGAIIALVGCHHGLNVRSGAEGVGRATTISVVSSFILIIMTDCLFTTLFYFIFNT